LAVALLQDRGGCEWVDLPVSGAIHDPDFARRGLARQALVKLIAKSRNIPLRPGGGLVGRRDVDHAHVRRGKRRSDRRRDGKAQGPGGKAPRTHRPESAIISDGDPATAKPRLAQALFDRKLKAQKALDLLKAGKPAPSVDDVVIAPEEFVDYLQRAYEAETFAKPKNMLGFAKALPPREAETLIRQTIVVGDARRAALAWARATAVRDALPPTGVIAAARPFPVNPADPLAPASAKRIHPAGKYRASSDEVGAGHPHRPVAVPDLSGHGDLHRTAAGPVVMIDHHHLLPGAELQAAVAHRQTDGRPQERRLDVAVAVAVVPGRFVGVVVLRRRQTRDGPLEIGHHPRLEFDGGEGARRAHHRRRQNAPPYARRRHQAV